jgi:hypothetical protein
VLAVFENIRAIRIPKLDTLDLVDNGALRIVIIETRNDDSFGASLCGFRLKPLRRRRHGGPSQRRNGLLEIRAVEEHHKINRPVALAPTSATIENLILDVEFAGVATDLETNSGRLQQRLASGSSHGKMESTK